MSRRQIREALMGAISLICFGLIVYFAAQVAASYVMGARDRAHQQQQQPDLRPMRPVVWSV